MKDTRLLEIFNDAKDTLCRYDYYIHTSKRILHLANTEQKIPHLMGLQYAGKKDMYTGNYGAYSIKKGRVTLQSIEKLVRKYYSTEEKQENILKMIHLKLDYLPLLKNMLFSYSTLYLFDVNANLNSGFDSDYLLIHEEADKILHLGLIKAKNGDKNICHCNSFMTTYRAERDYDLLYRSLQHRYEITKIVREEKTTRHAEVIYQSKEAKKRELSGIVNMLEAAEVSTDDKLVKVIYRLNGKFGCYHTMEMLRDADSLLQNCKDKREEALVSAFIKEAQKAGIIK